MKKSIILIRTRILIILLATLTPVWTQSQPTKHGYDDSQSVKTSQRDTEKHETELGWIGLFGLLGAVGLVGPDRMSKRRSRAGGAVTARGVLGMFKYDVSESLSSLQVPALVIV